MSIGRVTCAAGWLRNCPRCTKRRNTKLINELKNLKWIPGLFVISLLCMQCGGSNKPAPVKRNGMQNIDQQQGVNPGSQQNTLGDNNGAIGDSSTVPDSQGTASGGATTGNSQLDALSTFLKTVAAGKPASTTTTTSTGTGTGTASAGNADTTGCIKGDDFTCRAEAELVKATNEIRAEVGKPPLTHNFQLSFVARDWSIKQGGMISHTGFPLARASVFMENFPGVPVPSISGENVAMFSGGGEPESVGRSLAQQWKNSPGHYANMIGGYRMIGVGIKCSNTGSSNTASSGGTGIEALIAGLLKGVGGQCTGTQIFAN